MIQNLNITPTACRGSWKSSLRFHYPAVRQDLFNKKSTQTLNYTGHRERLRARFLSTTGEGMPDYELLELLLMLGISRRDLKPLAKELIDRFGDFAGVVSADVERLRNNPGLGETAIAAIKLAQASSLRLLQERIVGRDAI